MARRRRSTSARAAATRCSSARSRARTATGSPAPSCGHIAYVNPRLVVTTIPVNADGEVVLLRRGIEPGSGWWAQPGGFLEVDETVTEAAIRETLEETGLVVEPGEIVGLYSRLEAAVVVIAFEARVVGGEYRAQPRGARDPGVPPRGDPVARHRVQDDPLGAPRLGPPPPARTSTPPSATGTSRRGRSRRSPERRPARRIVGRPGSSTGITQRRATTVASSTLDRRSRPQSARRDGDTASVGAVRPVRRCHRRGPPSGLRVDAREPRSSSRPTSLRTAAAHRRRRPWTVSWTPSRLGRPS